MLSHHHNNQAKRRKVSIVILDTNALMMPFQFKLNLEQELDRLLGKYEIIVPSSVRAELEWLSKSNIIAKSALALSKRYRALFVGRHQTTDSSILKLAKQSRAYVVTNDTNLRTKLRAQNTPVIYLRSKTHLSINNE
jgi:hypothetical protein